MNVNQDIIYNLVEQSDREALQRIPDLLRWFSLSRYQEHRNILHCVVIFDLPDMINWIAEQFGTARELDLLLNEKDIQTRNPLILASINGKLECAKCLIACGTDVTVTTDKGDSALHLAAYNGCFDVVNFLIEHTSLQVTKVNSNRDSPLMLASYNGHLKIVQLCFEHGGSLTDLNASNDSPLSLAAFNGHTDIVNWLHEHDQLIDIQNTECNTPLALACYQGHLELVKWFLEKGLNVENINYEGETPLLLAAKAGFYNVCEFLLFYGADYTHKNHKGQDIFAIATNETQILLKKLKQSRVKKALK